MQRDDVLQLQQRLAAISRRLDTVEPLIDQLVERRTAAKRRLARPVPIARPVTPAARPRPAAAWRWLAAAAAGLAVVAVAITFALDSGAQDVVSVDRTDARATAVDVPRTGPPAAPAPGETVAAEPAPATASAAETTPVAGSPLPPQPAESTDAPATEASTPTPAEPAPAEPATPELHEVRWTVGDGDDLATIAASTGTAAGAIAERNGLATGTEPQPGQAIIVPTPRPTIRWPLAEGESLAAVAARFDTSIAAIVALNDLADPDLVQWGQTLLVLVGPASSLRLAGDDAPPPTTD